MSIYIKRPERVKAEQPAPMIKGTTKVLRRSHLNQYGPSHELVRHDVRGSKLCIVTVCMDKGAQGMELQTLPCLRAYAQKCGADFRVITNLGEGDKYQHAKYAVMQIGDYYDLFGYDRILYIDADVLVKPSAPNMFDTFPAGAFYARDEQKYKPAGWGARYHEKMEEWLETSIPFDGVHFNGGVQLSDRAHRALYSMPPWNVTDRNRLWYASKIVKNQPWFNVRRVELGIPFHDIGPEWNMLMSDGDREADMQDRAHFLHFATAPMLNKSVCAARRIKPELFDPRRVCVISVAVGEEATKCGAVSVPSHERWCKRHGYAYALLTETGDHISPAYTRLDGLALLDDYDLVVYLDNDVYVKHNAPNLAWTLPADGWDIAGFDSGELGYMHSAATHQMRLYCNDTTLPYPTGYNGAQYINSGVIVFNKSMRDYKPVESDAGYKDQNAFAYDIERGALRWFKLPRSWNYGHFHKPENITNAKRDNGVFFAHWTGVPYKAGRCESMKRFARDMEMCALGGRPL